MILFFKKIRQQLLSNGTTGKYLKYALGEIVLVMIGILLALQVNNWNQDRLNQQLKQSYIENLLVDLQKDMLAIEDQKEINTYTEQEGQYLEAFLGQQLTEIDTFRLTRSIIMTAFIPNATITNSTYNDLINSNHFHLFQDAQLKRLLDDYYIPNNWAVLFNERILQTAWFDYRDEMLKFHSPLLYRDFYELDNPVELGYSPTYQIDWKGIQQNAYLKTQVGMIVAYRQQIREFQEDLLQKAQKVVEYLGQSN